MLDAVLSTCMQVAAQIDSEVLFEILSVELRRGLVCVSKSSQNCVKSCEVTLPLRMHSFEPIVQQR